MAKVQAFYCNIIFLSFSCNCYTTGLKDLAWLAELSRCLKTNILLIISVKYVEEIVVAASHYAAEREINSKKSVVGPLHIINKKSIASFLCMYTFSCHHYLISYYDSHQTMEWAQKILQ